MAERGLFVDLLYAVTVGAALPRINGTVLHLGSAVLWGIGFLLVVFLEDFYLYHVKVLPSLTGPHSWRGFLLSVLIIGTWYLTEVAFPSNAQLFLAGFGMFFFLRIAGSLLYRTTARESWQEAIFAVPVVAAGALMMLDERPPFAGHPGRLLLVLFPAWLVTVAVWWSMNRAMTSGPYSISISS
jgi:hypothetical protein